MVPMPRVAIGTIDTDHSPVPMTLALVRWAARNGHVVQHFHSSATHHRHDLGLSAAGHVSRHLDSWTMHRDACRRMLAAMARQHTLAVVDGHLQLEDVASPARSAAGSRLNELCWWLDLPRLAVLDVRRLRDCRLPCLPDVCDGLLLDQVSNPHEYRQWQTVLEPLCGVPVVGGLEPLPAYRDELAALPAGCRIESTLCDALAGSFDRLLDRRRLERLAARRSCPPPASETADIWCIDRPITVAIGYDEAFSGYLPAALDRLESIGATVVDFSPLRDEGPPAEADMVWLGDGRPHDFAATLANNHCMLSALYRHVCSGRRLYAERGGMAYLCERLQGADGAWYPMLGILPHAAWYDATSDAELPIEIELAACCWLGRRATRLRGYRSSCWRFDSAGSGGTLSCQSAASAPELFCHRRVVASRLALDFAGQSALLHALIQPLAVKPLSSPIGTATGRP